MYPGKKPVWIYFLLFFTFLYFSSIPCRGDEKQINPYIYKGYFGVSTGGALTFLTEDVNRFPAGLGVLYVYDFGIFLTQAQASAFLSTDMDIYHGNLEFQLPLTPYSSTPFVMAGAGIADFNLKNAADFKLTHSERDLGAIFTGGIGYQFNRWGNLRVNLGLSGFYSTAKIAENNPRGVLLNLAVIFR
jgi:hypothetical protein